MEAQYLAEYEALREEILQKSHDYREMLKWSVVATGAMVWYGVVSQSPYVFLIPFSILIPAAHITLVDMDGVLKIGAYIHSRIETAMPGLRWETTLYEIRRLEHGSRKSNIGKPGGIIAPIATGYDMLFAVCFALAILYRGSEIVPIVLILFPALGYFLWWNYQIQTAFSYERQEQFRKLFGMIDSGEKGS